MEAGCNQVFKKSTGRQLKSRGHLAATHGQKWVTVISPGQTVFNIDDLVTKEEFDRENNRVRKLGENPATGQTWEEGRPKRLPPTKKDLKTKS